MTTVLIIDDEKFIRESIQAALRNAGYHTVVASNGIEGLKQLESTLPDLILLDVTMPQMDGLAFLRTIRRVQATEDVPVILLTGVSEKSEIVGAMDLGITDYMLKTKFSIDELLMKVARHSSKACLSNPQL